MHEGFKPLPGLNLNLLIYCLDSGVHYSLTEREFELIKTKLMPNSRKLLIKQGHESAVVTLNLAGFDYELAVISGTTDKVNLMHQLVEEVGSNPKDWLPLYTQALADKRGEQ